MKRARLLRRFGNLILLGVFLTGMFAYETQTAHTQDAAAPETMVLPSAPAQTNPQEPEAPDTVTCPEDPPMGERARLLDDQEIGLVFFAKDAPEAFYYAADNPRDGKDLIFTDNMGCNSGPCQSIQSPAITMADFVGDDQFMAVMAYRDSEKRVAIGIPSEDGVVETWYSDEANAQGKNVDWIDIAAGNLDGADTEDNRDEVVVAFRDNSKALNVLVPAAIDAPNKISAYYRDDSSFGRGNVKYVSAATGDLDGDGYDNEIVTVFKDGNKNLQTMIFRKQAGSQKLDKLWASSWTNHYRHGTAYSDLKRKKITHPIDVATGDIDGDFKDEVIIAFHDNNGHASCGQYQVYGHVQILVLDYVGDGSQKWSHKDIDDDVWVDADPTEGCPQYSDRWANIWPQSIGIAAADLDGDGGDEIALAYTFQNGNPPRLWNSYARLWTYEFVDVSDPEYIDHEVCQNDNGDLVACLRRTHKITFLEDTALDKHVYDRLTLDAGDLDRDGNAEVVIGYAGWDGKLHVITYDAKDKITKRMDIGIPLQGAQLDEFDLSMADMDGDAVYGTYADKQYLAWNSYVESVVHSPPYWPGDNDEATSAAFGQSVGHGGGSGKTSESSMGGSVTVKAEFDGVGPSFTAGWEKSCSVEQTDMVIETEGTTVKTITPFEDEQGYYMDAVGYHMCPRCCYEYIENAHNSLVTVCLPTRPCSAAKAGLDVWYKDRAHADPPEGVGDSWVPVGMNFARGKPSQQSSTAYGGTADRAVDGNTDGVFANGSVTFTDPDLHAWWGVDMLILPAVHAVQLWNRTDAAPERLSNFYIFLSEDPFSSDDPETLRQDPKVWHYYHSGPAGQLTTAAWSDFRDHSGTAPERSRELTGRYVKLQLTSSQTLSLAEVQVWGVPARVDQWPVSAPSSSDTVSFTLELPAGGSQLVDGEFILKRDGTLHVDDQGSPEFDNSIEEEWEQMTETSTSSDAKVGFSIKVAEADFTTGSKNVRSRIMTWSKETEFSGEASRIDSNPHYDYAPYMWLQRATSKSGEDQAFLVLDYWVPYIQTSISPAPAASSTSANPPVDTAPQAPLINSTTHPSSDAWYDSSTVSFSWIQPVVDPAVVAGYHWYLDRVPDTIPPIHKSELTTTHTYNNLDDGIWYLHVRAKSEGGTWGDTAHRTVKIDTQPPTVELVGDPPLPSGHSGWYNTPLLVTANADDGPGSGVATIQVSRYKTFWHPYTGSILFDSDTPERRLWARAIDELGHVSEPISTTFKIDMTPPDSKVQRDSMLGLLFARVLNDEMGVEHPILVGAVKDFLSKPSGMDLEINAFDWTSARQGLADLWFDLPDWIVNKPLWIYDGQLEISRGNLQLRGRSQDRAGNLEEVYDLAGELVWFPQASPDLIDSSLTAVPTTARPGDIISFVAAVRNHGNQEAMVRLNQQLPVGLTPLFDQLATGVGYDPTSRTLTWPERLIWPGEWHRYHFNVIVDHGMPMMALENHTFAQAYWPNTDELPTSERKRFQDLQQTVDFSTTVMVDPDLPLAVDNFAPWVYLHVLGDQMKIGPQVELSIQSTPDAHWMYLREWTLDALTGEWNPAQDSGWLPFSETFPWTLSPGAGVKYIGVWAADESNNISTLDEHSLGFTNLLTGDSVLADGQRHQYRFTMEPGNMHVLNLHTSQGDPDLYGWDPYHALLPNYAAEEDQPLDSISFYPSVQGIHLFEVLGRGDSRYSLVDATPEGAEGQSSPMAAEAANIRPQYPLTISNPLISGIGTIPVPPGDLRIHFPLVFNE